MKILEMVRDHFVETQEELAERLVAEGINVTQATVSRDIKELGLIKVPTGDGRYSYALSPAEHSTQNRERFRRLFADCVLGLNFSQNIVVIRTLPGTASAVGEAVDSLSWESVIGTLAGDNTLLVIVKPTEMAESITHRLERMLG